MKRMNLIQWFLMAAVLALLVSGCAKKPAPSAADGMAPPSEPPVTTEAPRQGDVRGIEESPITEGQTPAGQEERLRPQADATSSGLQRVYFDFDQYTLTSEAREALTGNAAFLKANPKVKVRIEGHCDERGSDEYNLALGERRALAVREFLISLGVESGRLSTISYGEEMPLVQGSGEEAWSQNRRAEFNIVSP